MIKIRSLYGLVALFLILCFGQYCTGDAGRETIVVFKDRTTNVSYKGEDDKITVSQPRSFSFPAFVGGVLEDNKEFLAVICGAKFYDSEFKEHIDGVVKTNYGDHNSWSDAEIFTNDLKTSTTHKLRKDFTAVMKEKKIYVLATTYLKQASSSTQRSLDNTWDPLMFVGTIIDSKGSDGTGASITWEEGQSLKSELANDLSEAEATYFIGGVGNGVVTKSGAIVFPIYMDQKNHQRTSAILYSTDNGLKWQIGKKTEDRTYDGSVVEWGDNKLLFIVSSYVGYRKVFQSDNMGTTWSESLMFSGVWGSAPKREKSGKQGTAITVPVDGKNVLFFAHPSNAKGGSNADTLQLWLSDGQRIVCIGTISEEDKEDHSGNSILAHVGNHLYITHEINPNGVWSGSEKVQAWNRVIGLSSLPQFFKSAKTTARAWKKLDELFLSKGVPTEGLVGFLGNTQKDNSVWEDMYKCVDAKVNGGKSVDGGICFDGKPESGAQWPVASQGQNQVYIFAEKQFTLAATVKIHAGSEKGQFALIGASLDSQGSKVLLGLDYTHENKWFTVTHQNQEITTEKSFEREMEYHVALTFENGAAAVYVDGEKITDNELKIQKTLPIDHFYMGAIEQSSAAKGNSCTVKNVMLFNRNLEENKIAELTKVSKNGKLGELLLEALPTLISEDGISDPKTKDTTTPVINQPAPNTKSTSVPDISKSVQKTKSIAVPDIGKPVPNTKSTRMPKDSKYVSTTETNTASVSSTQTVPNGKADDKNLNKFKHEINEGVFQKDTKGDNGAVVSFSAIGLLCLVCSFIALTEL